ncbi:MAG TPA: PAS domain S-box protein, partial [Azonexus sp.]|nr:PAS domain S-box protein [Azonexus sp.]
MAANSNEASELRIVAFGASAGGLQALRPIINGLQRHSGTAYLVAHHLSPVHPSSLTELLAAKSQLTVVAASQDEHLLADHVYICPPGHDIELANGQLTLTPTDSSSTIAPSIDRLFRSLAEALGENAVAVILSGSGHDGTAGAEAVNAANGTVIIQDPDEAVQPGMPQAAINAGFADLIGNSDEITEWLNHLDRLQEALEPAAIDAAAQAFGEIFHLVVNATGLDLAQYKENTLRRQTIRRYRALGMTSLEEYLCHLRSHPEELHPLQHSFLISVSSFFRDPSVFEALEKSLRKLIAGKQLGDSIRVWIPACATGEEAYSIGILLAEALGDRLGKFDVRIFATDIDQSALDFARAGIYSTAALAELDVSRRRRWFTAEGSGWRIGKSIRELCIFSLHDVIAHPPFIKMDLVSCRNLLIYFKPEQQADLISTFHYGLNPDGLLLLGKSEAAGFNSRLFETVDASHKLYRRRNGAATHPARYARFGAPHPISRPLLPSTAVTPQRQSLVDATLNTIAREYGPPGVLVNANFEPLHFFGHSQRYFALPGDHADFSVFSLCLPKLRSELKALCYRLIQENLDNLQGSGVDVEIDGEELRIRPVLRRIAYPGTQDESAFLISFDEIRTAESAPESAPATPDDRHFEEIIRLRQELADSREHLQAVIEELEASNEELQSLNEEVQSSSEELQSSNEELQSSNEELTTLNDELRVKSLEAVQLTTTLSNVQNSIRTSLVVVDHEGRITRYNALATRIFGLVANDIGQFLYGIPCHLQLPGLRQQVSEVVATGNSLVEQVRQGEFHYLMQLDPYRDELGENVGAVLTFSDISDLHRAELAQQSSEVRFQQVWEASLEGLLVVNSQGQIALANPALEVMFGYTPGQLIGQAIEVLVPEAVRAGHVAQRDGFLRRSEQTRQVSALRNIHGQRQNGSEFPVEISLSGMTVNGEHFVLASVSDITERKQAEDALRDREYKLSAIIANSPSVLSLKDPDGRYALANPNLQRIHHLAEADIVGKTDFDLYLDEIAQAFRANDQQLLSTLARHSVEEIIPVDGQQRIYMSHIFPILDESGQAQFICRISLDITERKRLDAELREYQEQLETQVVKRTTQLSDLYNRAPCGYQSLDAEGVFVNINDTELGWLGYTREEVIGRIKAIDLMAPDSRPVFQEYFQKLTKTGEISGLEFDFVRKNGSLLPILVHGKAVYDDDGRFLHTLSTIIDNTERKRAEKAWVAAREVAESANRAKSAFLANMSHEIR